MNFLELVKKRYSCRAYKALNVEKEKMLAGEVYSAVDPQLLSELMETREKIHEYNSLRPKDIQKMKALLKELLGHIGDDEIIINQPFRCDYGKQISVGKRFFANFNFTVLDEALVTIGDDCFMVHPTFRVMWQSCRA